jgi:flagellar biogenesis protein FliO
MGSDTSKSLSKNSNSSASVIPYKTTNTPFQEHGSNELFVILVFALLAWGVFIFLKKKSNIDFSFKKDKRIKLIERTNITARSSIVLIECNNRQFLMSQSADHLSLITELELEDK